MAKMTVCVIDDKPKDDHAQSVTLGSGAVRIVSAGGGDDDTFDIPTEKVPEFVQGMKDLAASLS